MNKHALRFGKIGPKKLEYSGPMSVGSVRSDPSGSDIIALNSDVLVNIFEGSI